MNQRELLAILRKLGPEQVIDGHELCPTCDSLSPSIDMDGETIVHCPICRDKGIVSTEEAERWRQEMRERFGTQR